MGAKCWKSVTVSNCQTLYGVDEVKLWMFAEVEAHVKAYKSDLVVDFAMLDDLIKSEKSGLYFYVARKHGTHFINGREVKHLEAVVDSFPDAVIYALILHQGYFDGFYAEVCRVDFVGVKVVPRRRWTFRKPCVPSGYFAAFDFLNTDTGEVLKAPESGARYEVLIRIDYERVFSVYGTKPGDFERVLMRENVCGGDEVKELMKKEAKQFGYEKLYFYEHPCPQNGYLSTLYACVLVDAGGWSG